MIKKIKYTIESEKEGTKKYENGIVIRTIEVEILIPYDEWQAKRLRTDIDRTDIRNYSQYLLSDSRFSIISFSWWHICGGDPSADIMATLTYEYKYPQQRVNNKLELLDID